ncbi:MAG TPA: hypothetical protein VFB78_14445 [Acidimicrobiales bacterium]|nr:hypothetical protein [Acidimicrobiales bacterium]
MYSRFRRGLALIGASTVALLMLHPAAASAHEHRHVAGGKYSFTVGWGDEPAYSGFKNSVSLGIEDANGKPVNDVTDTLKVEVSSGTQKTTLTMEPNFEIGEFGDPGDYRAWMVPTRSGTYTFHFTGTIHGDAIDETFKSSETTFDDIKAASEVEFPAKDPTNGELAQRLERAETRATASAKKAKDDAGTARTFGIVGIALGALGLVVGLSARSRRS